MRIFAFALVILLFDPNSAQSTGSSCKTYFKEAGLCVDIRKCTKIWTILTKVPRPLPNDLEQYIINSRCGTELYCCRPQDIEGSVQTIQPTRVPVNSQNSQNSNSDSDITNHRNLRLLDQTTCGSATGDRISNGNLTNLFEFPWNALLGYTNSLGDVEYLCGGTLITTKVVLTAAHCAQNTRQSRLTSVRLGEYDTTTPIDCQTNARDSVCAPAVQEIPVREVIPHPDYVRSQYLNDIALVKLQYAADTSDFAVKTICLPITASLLRSNPQAFVVTGWGTTERGIKSEKLLKARVPVVARDRCQEAMSQLSRRVQLTDAHFCAGGEGNNVDTCSGDSGGPIQVAANFNGDVRIVQYGIVSFGPNWCGNSGTYPGVYTNLRHFLVWVLDNLA